MLQEKYGRDVFLPESQFEGLKIGDSVSFVLQVKDGKPQAFEVKRLSKKSNLTSPALAPSPDEHLELPEVKEVTEVQTEIEAQDPQELSKSSRRLIRACQSERPGSIEDVQAALEDGAEVNARDVTGQTPLMISSLNTRGADRKCKLLLEHRADLQLPSDPMSTQSTLEWVKERINQRFADYLEALSKGEAAKLELTLDAPVFKQFIFSNPNATSTSTALSAMSTSRELLDLDPEKPKFLLPTLGTLQEASEKVKATNLPVKKPRIGHLEESSTLSSVRSFLSAATATGLSDLAGKTCDPVISEVPDRPEVLMPKAIEKDEDTTSEDEKDEPKELAVEMDLGLGVMDVLGSPEPLLKRGIPEAVGHLKEAEQPLVEELASHAN
eukprot:symbB.v1.2.003127.t1/scaffold128.1/size312424/1